MIDKVLKKQLEKFGTEYTQAVEAESEPQPFNQSLNVVKNTMSTMEGRAWIFAELSFCGVNATSFVPNDPCGTAFNCGLQEYGHHLQNQIISVAPNEYSIMLQEAAANPSAQPTKPQHQSA